MRSDAERASVCERERRAARRRRRTAPAHPTRFDSVRDRAVHGDLTQTTEAGAKPVHALLLATQPLRKRARARLWWLPAEHEYASSFWSNPRAQKGVPLRHAPAAVEWRNAARCRT